MTTSTEKMQECRTCKRVLPILHFHRNTSNKTGHNYQCRSCASAYRKKYYLDHKDGIRAWKKRYYHENYARIIEANQRYVEQNKAKVLSWKSAWGKRNRKKGAAKRRIGAAIQRGDLVRQPCEMCPKTNTNRIQGHHHNYQKPLEVNWLCQKHHRFIHRVLRAIAGPLTELEI